MASVSRFIKELQRRNVFRAGAAYLVVTWLLVQISDIVLGAFAVPAWALRAIVMALALGFPVAVVLAWIYEITTHGVKRTERVAESASTSPQMGRQVDFVIIGVLLVGIALFAADRFMWIDFGTETSADRRSIAVLPLEDLSIAGDQEWLAEGLTEELLNSLARLPELQVIARSSAFHFKNQDMPLHEIAKKLNVDYVVEGSVRRVDDRLRLTAKLIRISDGVQIWSNVYDRLANDVLDVQVEVAENIAKALDVVLDDSQRAFMFATGTRNVEAFEAFLKGRSIFDAVHRGDRTVSLWTANKWFEKAISLDPTYAAAHYMHHDAYPHFLMSAGADPMTPADQESDISDASAMERMRTDLESAVTSVTSPSLRASIDIDRTVLLDTWYRLPELFRILEISAKDGHTETRLLGWTDLVLVALGHAEITLRRADNQLQTDPYESLNWINGAMALLALDRPEDAIDYLQRGRRLAGDHEFMNRIEAMAHLMQGDVENAAKLFMKEETLVALAYALLRQEERARRTAAAIEKRNPRQEELILVFAVLGDQANVDRLSRVLDSSTVGSLQLLRAMYYVAGGVPFNMRETPNFRMRLLEAGIEPNSLEAWKPDSIDRRAK
jgi:TolB-like protein